MVNQTQNGDIAIHVDSPDGIFTSTFGAKGMIANTFDPRRGRT